MHTKHIRLISSRLLDEMRLDLSLPGPWGGRTYGQRQGTSLDWLSVHRKVLCEHLWVHYIAQGHLGSPLKSSDTIHYNQSTFHVLSALGPNQTAYSMYFCCCIFLDFFQSYLAIHLILMKENKTNQFQNTLMEMRRFRD